MANARSLVRPRSTRAGVQLEGQVLAERRRGGTADGPQVRPHPAAHRPGHRPGAIFLVIFRYIFGGAISAGGLPYVDFLVPGFVTTGILFAGMGAAARWPRTSSRASSTGCGPADPARGAAGRPWPGRHRPGDLEPGRGHGLGFAVGFRMHGSVAAGRAAAFGLCVLFSFAFEWVFITIGLVAGTARPEGAMSC